MARTATTTHNTRSTRSINTTTRAKPSLMSRLKGRNNAKVTTKESTNPLTGAHTVTKKTTTHPKGLGHHGHGGKGPLASDRTTAAPVHHHQRKPSMGDKVSGAMMKLRGSLTGKPGLKAAGTRRERGTDGKGSHVRRA